MMSEYCHLICFCAKKSLHFPWNFSICLINKISLCSLVLEIMLSSWDLLKRFYRVEFTDINILSRMCRERTWCGERERGVRESEFDQEGSLFEFTFKYCPVSPQKRVSSCLQHRLQRCVWENGEVSNLDRLKSGVEWIFSVWITLQSTVYTYAMCFLVYSS